VTQAPLFTLVSAAQAQETPAVSPVVRSRKTCGTNCGIENAAATMGK
jgi:hypothetical protein